MSQHYTPTDLVKRFSGALAYVAVENKKGDQNIGTAFHIGSGIFVTARHVVENLKILEVATTARAELIAPSGDSAEVHYVDPKILTLSEGPFYHPNPTVDIATFIVANHDAQMPRVPLDLQFDHDIRDDSFVLADVVVLGYPPIPNTVTPRLLATRAEVNAVVDPRHAPYAHYIMSATARGGFSGGPAIALSGKAIGVVTESFVRDDGPAELGYMTVLSIEPVYQTLADHWQILEDDLAFGAMYQQVVQGYRLTNPALAHVNPRLATAIIQVYDDDRDVFMEIRAPDSGSLLDAYNAINQVTPFEIVAEQSSPGNLFIVPRANPSAEELTRAATAAVVALTQRGFIPIDRPTDA